MSITAIAKVWSGPAVNRLLKSALISGALRPWGPIGFTSKKSINSKALKAGNNYILDIPSSEKSIVWYKKWNNKLVTLVGGSKESHRGSQMVYVSQAGKPGFFIALDSWLVSIQPPPCNCATDIIWAKGCQCGGS